MFGNLISQLINTGIIKKVNSNSTPVTNNDLNNSPRFVDINKPRETAFSGQNNIAESLDINKPRTVTFSGADVNSNTYGKTNDIQDFFKDIMLKEGGEVLARGNKLAKHKPTKLY